MSTSDDIFASADWYDRGINWDARLARELPVLAEAFGSPGDGGLLDAGCGSGRHLIALAQQGYRVTGLDASAGMLALARRRVADACVAVDLVAAPFIDAAHGDRLGYFDGVFCLGNALAACGRIDEAKRSLAALGAALRPGGRLFLQVLNFAKLRGEHPRVRGPRVRVHDGVEYVSTRTYAFVGEQVEVTNVTLWNDGGTWRQHAHAGTLTAIARGQLLAWCAAAGLVVEAEWGGYDRAPFDAATSNDLIVVALRA